MDYAVCAVGGGQGLSVLEELPAWDVDRVPALAIGVVAAELLEQGEFHRGVPVKGHVGAGPVDLRPPIAVTNLGLRHLVGGGLDGVGDERERIQQGEDEQGGEDGQEPAGGELLHCISPFGRVGAKLR